MPIGCLASRPRLDGHALRLGLLLGMGGLTAGCRDPEIFEGDYPGECCDGADNDRDGKFDFDDPDCKGAAACEDDTEGTADQDGDGVLDDDDCAPRNADIFPGNTETPYDGINNDCDDATPDDDLDGDGKELDRDCDDTDPDVYVGGFETPYNGKDDDCDPLTLDDDLDGDGLGIDDDCDDGDATVDGALADECLSPGRASVRVVPHARAMKLGSDIALLDDMDGDGQADLVVGAQGADGDIGAVFLISGGDLRDAGVAGLSTEGVATVWTGRARYDTLGAAGSLLEIPDTTGDGLAELLICNPGADPGGNSNAGAVFVVHSDDATAMGGGLLNDVASYAILGAHAGDKLGSAAAVADFGGDGVADLALMSAQADLVYSNSGMLALFDGTLAGTADISVDDADVRVHGYFNEVMGFGRVRVIGDLDGDGVVELAIGSDRADATAEVDAGKVYVLSSGLLSPDVELPDGVDLSAAYVGDVAMLTIEGLSFAEEFGSDLVMLPDTDGDGDDELLVSAPMGDVLATNGGAVYRFAGEPGAGGVWTTADAVAVWGGADVLAAAGGVLVGADLDGDGIQDVLASTVYGPTGGRVFGLLSADLGDWGGDGEVGTGAGLFSASGTSDAHGSAVLAGDLDGTGLADVVIGAPAASSALGAATGSVVGFLR